ncbi:a-type inclusion protein [Anaeramoeba ignava]|uniref:A-type inclusion protein n=1 Tax=Anaeramoeba ignava TaxID=1746090 RepID=A0A9Q0R8K5_ANAIG|nr:a-type inclusion protein [Anaeramoeba ignava]
MGQANAAKKKLAKKQTKEYKRLINECSEPIILANDKANFVFANKAAIKAFKAKNMKDIVSRGPPGLSAEYQPFFKMPTKEVAPIIVKTAFESPEGFYDFDFLHVDLNGKEFWCHVWLTPINWAGKFVLQGYTRPVSGPNIVKTFDLGEEASFFIKPVADKAKTLSKDESENSQQDFDTFAVDDFKSTTENSDIEIKQEKKDKQDKQEKQDIQDIPIKDTSTQMSSVLLISNDEFEMDLDDSIDKIKSIIRSQENPKLEKKIVEELNKIKRVFEECNKSNQTHISKLADRLKTERERNKDKYNELESHLQKNLEKSQKTQLGFELAILKLKSIQELTTDPNLTQFF